MVAHFYFEVAEFRIYQFIEIMRNKGQGRKLISDNWQISIFLSMLALVLGFK